MKPQKSTKAEPEVTYPGPGTYIEHKDGSVWFTIIGVGPTAEKALGMLDRLRASIILPKAED